MTSFFSKSDVAVDLQQTLKVCTLPAATTLMQTISNQVAAWTRETQNDKSLKAMADFQDSPSSETLSHVQTCLQASPTLPDEVSQALPGLACNMIDWLSTPEVQANYTPVAAILQMLPGKDLQTQLDIARELAALTKSLTQPGPSLPKDVINASAGKANADPGFHLFHANASRRLADQQERYKALVTDACNAALAKMQAAVAKLSAVSGGAQGGGIWWQVGDNEHGDKEILNIYTEFLAPVDKDNWEKQVHGVTTTMAIFNNLLSTHKTHLPGLSATFPGDLPEVQEAHRHLLRSSITRYERLLCQTLQRGGAQLRNRVETFTAQVAAAAREPWQRVLAPKLVEALSEHLSAASG